MSLNEMVALYGGEPVLMGGLLLVLTVAVCCIPLVLLGGGLLAVCGRAWAVVSIAELHLKPTPSTLGLSWGVRIGLVAVLSLGLMGIGWLLRFLLNSG